MLSPHDLCLQIAPVWASLHSQHLGQWCKLLAGRTQKWAQLIRPVDSRERSDSLIFNSFMSKTSVWGTRLKLFFVWSGAAIWPQVTVSRRLAVASTPQGSSPSVSYHSFTSLGKTLVSLCIQWLHLHSSWCILRLLKNLHDVVFWKTTQVSKENIAVPVSNVCSGYLTPIIKKMLLVWLSVQYWGRLQLPSPTEARGTHRKNGKIHGPLKLKFRFDFNTSLTLKFL